MEDPENGSICEIIEERIVLQHCCSKVSVWEASWGQFLGFLGGVLEAYGRPLGGVLETVFEPLGARWGPPGGLWGTSSGFLRPLGGFLMPPGGLLGPSWAFLGPSWAPVGSSYMADCGLRAERWSRGYYAHRGCARLWGRLPGSLSTLRDRARRSPSCTGSTSTSQK